MKGVSVSGWWLDVWWKGVCEWVGGGGVFVNGWVVEGCL